MSKLTILFLVVGVHVFAAPTEVSPVSTALVSAKLQPTAGLTHQTCASE